jgi:V/A-type H+-transporting ATPase subunit A
MTLATITWASGPVLRARAEGPFRLREAIRVGPLGLAGEVIRLQEDEIVAQVYEDTTGLRPGVAVEGTGELLGIRVGPHLLGNIFDGLLRPLRRAGESAVAQHILPGAAEDVASSKFRFEPTVAVGTKLEAGAIFGRVLPALGRTQAALLPPDASGMVEWISAEAQVDVATPVLRLATEGGGTHEIALAHYWPVRTPRPVAARLPSDEPLVTGQRILDSLFPVALGGKAAIPGGFGTGKTILLESLAKGCSADVIVYLGCGERGNEMAGVLEEFPQLEDPRTGRPLMERTVVIANTSNMPVAAREASIYAGVTVAEYFRDQGLHVALMADSTSRWAEALREVSGRFGELPGEGGYPNYLSSRIADFYERAAKVKTLAGGTGSVMLLGSISPPSGDFSEPVTSHTKRYVRSFWALDARRAQARFYPAVNPLQSYSEDSLDMAVWWQKIYANVATARARAASGENEWLELRRRVLTLMDEQARLERMARIIGKDALPARQRLLLACAELVNDAFSRQSAFSPVDRYCGPQRQAAMLRLLAHFIERAERALTEGATPEQVAALPIVRSLARMGEDIGEEAVAKLAELETRMDGAFDALAGGPAAVGASTSQADSSLTPGPSPGGRGENNPSPEGEGLATLSPRERVARSAG